MMYCFPDDFLQINLSSFLNNLVASLFHRQVELSKSSYEKANCKKKMKLFVCTRLYVSVI